MALWTDGNLARYILISRINCVSRKPFIYQTCVQVECLKQIVQALAKSSFLHIQSVILRLFI